MQLRSNIFDRHHEKLRQFELTWCCPSTILYNFDSNAVKKHSNKHSSEMGTNVLFLDWGNIAVWDYSIALPEALLSNIKAELMFLQVITWYRWTDETRESRMRIWRTISPVFDKQRDFIYYSHERIPLSEIQFKI